MDFANALPGWIAAGAFIVVNISAVAYLCGRLSGRVDALDARERQAGKGQSVRIDGLEADLRELRDWWVADHRGNPGPPDSPPGAIGPSVRVHTKLTGRGRVRGLM